MNTQIKGKSLLSLFVALVVAFGLVSQAAAAETIQTKALSIAQERLGEEPLQWEKATVEPVGDSKAWVTVAPDQQQFNGGARFYRVAVDTEQGVVTVQDYQVSAFDTETGLARATLYVDGELFWFGTVSQQGTVVTDENSPEIDANCTCGACEWAVGGLCGFGGEAACYGGCIALGVAAGPVGLGCALVCGLISKLGCAAATKKICG